MLVTRERAVAKSAGGTSGSWARSIRSTKATAAEHGDDRGADDGRVAPAPGAALGERPRAGRERHDGDAGAR